MTIGTNSRIQIQAIIERLATLSAGSALHDDAVALTPVSRSEIIERSAVLAEIFEKTVIECQDLDRIIELLHEWMRDQTIVRVFGAGRARLAASIAANRLAHGGARVFIQDDLIPLPHTIKGGAVLAASASGRTPSVLEPLKRLRSRAPHIVILGIADANAAEFKELCHYFIGIRSSAKISTALHALADFGEFAIAEVLDALTVAAGRHSNYDERMWKLGHENVGASGPYDELHLIDLMFYES